MEIRIAERKDLEFVRDLYSKYYLNEEDLNHFLGKVSDFVDGNLESIERDFTFLVADDGQFQGVIGFRTPHKKILLPLAKTEKPIELYSLFVSGKQKGTGKLLVDEMIKISKNKKYTEILVYSGHLFKKSWGFYDKIGFERIEPLPELGGEDFMIWRKIL